jgi:hypothetical protein
MTLNKDHIIKITSCWIDKLVIAENFCPFAKPVFDQQEIHYCVIESDSFESVLHQLIEECKRLDTDDSIETTLLILVNGFELFDVFLDLIDIADRLLIEQGYEGIYQLAHFHPDYCFEGVDINDAQNYTNRSPFPMLHLLRENSIERALQKVKAPENIPERNIRHAQRLGLQTLNKRLEMCRNLTEEEK